ncbi:hypothetical protein D9M71_370560 [compost metagenome]
MICVSCFCILASKAGSKNLQWNTRRNSPKAALTACTESMLAMGFLSLFVNARMQMAPATRCRSMTSGNGLQPSHRNHD